MISIGFIEKFKALPDFERKNIILSSAFTVVIHIIIILLLNPSSGDNEKITEKPNFIKAKILIKGEKDGTNSYNAKTDKIRTKKKKFLPDRIRKNKAVTPPKKTSKGKSVIRPIDKNIVKLGKEKKTKKTSKGKSVTRPTEKKLSSADRMNALLSLKKINPALPSDKKNSKDGNLGKRKGGKNGVEDGNETDPSKVLAGSLYERRVATKIKSKWKTPVLDSNSKNLTYRIRIFINKDGSFNFNILKKSNNIFFNNSVSKVLKKIKKVEAPAPSFQKYYKEKGFTINFFPKN